MATLRGAVVHRPWLSLLAITVILLMIVFGTTPVEVRPLQGVEQAQVGKPAVQPVRPAPVVAAPEWPRITPEWEYTLAIPPVPIVDDEIYNGRASDTTWGTPGSRDSHANETRRRVARHIVPSITENDAVGLSIRRNPDNPRVVLAAVHIIRDVATTDGMRQETHLALSVDDQASWIILQSPSDNIDDVVVTGTSLLHLAIRPFSSHGYWQAKVKP